MCKFEEILFPPPAAIQSVRKQKVCIAQPQPLVLLLLLLPSVNPSLRGLGAELHFKQGRSQIRRVATQACGSANPNRRGMWVARANETSGLPHNCARAAPKKKKKHLHAVLVKTPPNALGALIDSIFFFSKTSQWKVVFPPFPLVKNAATRPILSSGDKRDQRCQH